MPSETEPGLVSLVVPVFNEAESLAPLLQEIVGVADGLDVRIEVVFVDDGSSDASWSVIRSLATGDRRVRGVRFRRNFGKAAALQAGFEAARGDIVVTLDADLQDDPHEIPKFLAALRGGLDVVSGWKKVRLDPWHKTLPSKVFNRLVSWLTGVRLHDHNCGFKAYRVEVLRELELYGEMHRFVPVLAAGRGFRVGEVPVHHRPRRFGRSKYGWHRFVKGAMDLITVHFLTKFGRRPQHLLGSYGLGLGCGGSLTLVLTALLLATGALVGPLAQFLAWLGLGLGAAGIVLGGQLLATGLLAELLIARKTTDREPYSISEQTPAGMCSGNQNYA